MAAIVVGNARLSYVSVWEPRPNKAGTPKYSCSIMIAEDNEKTLREVKRAINQTIDDAIEAGSIKAAAKPGILLPLRSGTDEYNMEKKDATYNGYYFMNAYSDNQPGVVDGNVQPIMEQSEIYSGIWANVHVNFYFTKKGGEPRIAVGLNHIMKIRDDDRLDGRVSVEDAFAKYVKGLSNQDDLT